MKSANLIMPQLN